MTPPQDRAVFFVDGSNWYHSLRDIGLDEVGRLSYQKICEKLAGPRAWTATRYYIPDVGIIGSPQLLADQTSFLSYLRSQDSRISVHIGRLEPRTAENEAAKELLHYLGGLKIRIPIQVYKDLIALGKRHAKAKVFVEKAIDVQIAIDMVVMAVNGEYETAYLLSADGDYTPAIDAVRGLGKKVFAASPGPCKRLSLAANSYIRLKRDWFNSCFP
ncbi:MAG TPA: NYN domain-containing protein [Acidobacteriota bacterium]|nr:NYN domain-containing protein [Acidobacteriota bacterium]